MVKTFDLNDAPARPARPARPEKRGGKRGRTKNALDGWIVLDKPVGPTSTQALGAVKRLFSPDKAGHAGTLDPLASGLLPLALGEATKTVPHVVDGEKAYRFTVTWGSATDTDDADGTVIAASDVRPDRAAIEAALPAFVGEDVEQIPPRFSAVKVDGERAYDRARDGEEVTLAPRTVTIRRLAIVGEAGRDSVVLEAECGKGTYVRALARDLGARLGTCAHVSALRRTRVGPFGEADMITLEALKERAASSPQDAIDEVLRAPAEGLAELPVFPVDRNGAGRLRRGQSVLVRPGDPVAEGPMRAMFANDLVALCAVERGTLQPNRVFRAPKRRITVPSTGTDAA